MRGTITKFFSERGFGLVRERLNFTPTEASHGRILAYVQKETSGVRRKLDHLADRMERQQ